MTYRSVAPQLKSSCYNCRHFQTSEDMLNGLCFHNTTDAGKAAIGIGTCGHFAMKCDTEFSWSRVIRRAPEEAAAAR